MLYLYCFHLIHILRTLTWASQRFRAESTTRNRCGENGRVWSQSKRHTVRHQFIESSNWPSICRTGDAAWMGLRLEQRIYKLRKAASQISAGVDVCPRQPHYWTWDGFEEDVLGWAPWALQEKECSLLSRSNANSQAVSWVCKTRLRLLHSNTFNFGGPQRIFHIYIYIYI